MPGPNTTGVPNIADIMLGRGEVFAAALGTDGKPKGYRHVGNVPSISVGTSLETKEHFSSMSGLKSQDLSVVLSDARTLSLQLEELNHENLALFFSGEKATETNSGYAGFAEHLMVADGDLQSGHWYDIKNAAGLRAVDVDGTKLTIKTNEGPPNTLVEGTDYTLDAKFGKVFLRADSTDVQDAITNEVGLLVTLTADSTAVQTSQIVRGLTGVPVALAVKILVENAATGEKFEVDFHKVRLKASGDAAFISDEWQTLSLEGAIEENQDASTTSPYFSVRSVGSPLAQIVSATFVYDTTDVAFGFLRVVFDKAINIADLAPTGLSLGVVKFRTDDTLAGDWAGSESEYWLVADPEMTYNASTFTLEIVIGSFASHSDTLSENQATFDFAALGITDKATGLALPNFGTVAITMLDQ